MSKFISKVQERIDHGIFLCRTDRPFLIAVLIAIAGFVGKLIGVLLSDSGSPWWVQLGPVAVALLGAVLAFLRAHKFQPRESSDNYVLETKQDFLSPDGPVAFREVKASAVEQAAGFETCDPGFNAGETALVSEALNAWLATQPAIPATEGTSRAFGLLDATSETVRDWQQRYLYAQVYGTARSTNEVKYSLGAPVLPGIGNVILHKVTYYDALVTNAAFRARLLSRHGGHG